MHVRVCASRSEVSQLDDSFFLDERNQVICMPAQNLNCRQGQTIFFVGQLLLRPLISWFGVQQPAAHKEEPRTHRERCHSIDAFAVHSLPGIVELCRGSGERVHGKHRSGQVMIRSVSSTQALRAGKLEMEPGGVNRQNRKLNLS